MITPNDDAPLSFLRSAVEREETRKNNPPICTAVHFADAYFDWSWKGCGYGQLSFSIKDGVWSCETECMGPEATRKLLHAFADHVADQLEPILDAERRQGDA